MKKFASVLICCIILSATFLPLTVFAWDTPQLKLNVSYDENKQEITVDYRVNDFAGTESADFVLRYDSDVVEYVEHEKTKLSDSLLEIENVTQEERVAIMFANLYYVKPEDCDEDGGKTIAAFTFKVKDENATEAVFIATAESCAMDPDSQNVNVSRYTEKVYLTNTETESSDSSNTADTSPVIKVYVAAAIAFAVLVGGTVAVVVKYRKK